MYSKSFEFRPTGKLLSQKNWAKNDWLVIGAIKFATAFSRNSLWKQCVNCLFSWLCFNLKLHRLLVVSSKCLNYNVQKKLICI